MSLSKTLYNAIMRRTSTFAMAVVVGAFVFERSFDLGVDYVWNTHNKGKLWEHIKDKYEEQ